MQGWQLADELNRAFAHEKWSGFVPGVHLVTAANIVRRPPKQFDINAASGLLNRD